MTTTHLALVVAGACTLALGGCLADANNRHTLGRLNDPANAVELEAFRDRAGATTPDAARAHDEPGPRTLDRSAWTPQEVLVPVDGTYGYPRYARPPRWTDDTARQRGDPVTVSTALELEGDTLDVRVAETAASPFLAAWDGVLLIPRFFYLPPWQEVRHLPRSYWRVPAARQATSVTAPVEQPADTAPTRELNR
ncbi:MAG: hypothetical protein SFY69_04985 [Planctomycetota bacterium]|nr:hypothetical protein [Planctomycetota bacterium]